MELEIWAGVTWVAAISASCVFSKAEGCSFIIEMTVKSGWFVCGATCAREFTSATSRHTDCHKLGGGGAGGARKQAEEKRSVFSKEKEIASLRINRTWSSKRENILLLLSTRGILERKKREPLYKTALWKVKKASAVGAAREGGRRERKLAWFGESPTKGKMQNEINAWETVHKC